VVECSLNYDLKSISCETRSLFDLLKGVAFVPEVLRGRYGV
jgi:hypothetical protein